jgi:zinc protease
MPPSARTLRLAFLALAVLAALPAAAAPAAAVEIPYQKFVLDNGLTLLVHEDHKAPIVAVNVWYHVGSKNEKTGKTGFAHLFEHLMFNGSENFDDDYFKAIESVGATDVNGTTNEDRTNYFQNVPTSALDRVLFVESDRMGHLLGAVSQDKLDEQIGVVQNEKRQYENEPYTVSSELITKGAFPPGHPYSWTVIGSMEDLGAAALEDVHEWFKGYYGAANAVVVIAGDVDAATAKAKVEQYFGDIPPGPPVARFDQWVAKRTGTKRQQVEDRVPQARLYKVWNVPGFGTAELDHLDLLTDVLAAGKTSRLYKRLVYDDRIASDVSAYLDDREIASLFVIEATAVPGGDLAAVEKAVDEELARLVAEGPTAAEVERAASRQLAAFVRGAERIGGFGGKSDVLARCQVYTGDPECWQERLARVGAATPAALTEVGREWLSDGQYVLEVHPYAEREPATAGIDRSTLPEPGGAPQPDFPKLQRAELGNGLDVVVVERHGTPLVRLSLLVEAGYAADQLAREGTAAFAAAMLDEGTASRSALDVSDQVAALGATLGTGADLDVTEVSMTALETNLEPSLELFADVALNPAFPAAEVERLRAERIAAIQREKASPINIALRTLPKLMFGAGHAYATSFTGSGTEASVAAMSRDELARFHQTWFKPDNATLVVVGDTTMAEIRPRLERLFGGWQAGEVPKLNIAPVDNRPAEVYLVDRPGSIQSVILAGHVVAPKANPREQEVQAANEILGGGFTSRVNMNLREDKGWAYGAGTFVPDTAAQRPLILWAPVQADQTGPAMQEVLAELRAVTADEPLTEAELERVKMDRTLSLPGSWETTGELSAAVEEVVRYGLPDDYWEHYPEALARLDLATVREVAGETFHPDQLIWVVVGDRAKVEQQIRDAGFSEIRLIDADGEPVG